MGHILACCEILSNLITKWASRIGSYNKNSPFGESLSLITNCYLLAKFRQNQNFYLPVKNDQIASQTEAVFDATPFTAAVGLIVSVTVDETDSPLAF